MLKAAFFDIDGTLISFRTHKMPETTLQALQTLRRQSVKLFIATGRAPKSTDFLKEYFDFDGTVSFNGQYCFDHNGVIYQNPLPAESVRQAIPYMAGNDIACCFETLEKNVFNLVDQRVLDLLALVGMAHVVPECADVSNLNADIYQLTAYVSAAQESGLMRLMPGCKAVRWYPTFVNIIVENGGKPVGIAKVCEKYGLSIDEIMAFGDGGNDVDMLRFAGTGVAMGNAADSVKQAADYVTADIDDDGIFKALKHFDVI
ncbi:MAG: Cof-type HAD-IIB family hydrolase [Alphaproteobacteria bacterium]